MASQLPPPGWYPDPRIPQQSRYWDGARWSEHIHAARPGAVSPASAMALDGQRSAIPWWQSWLVIVPGLLFCLPLGLVGLWRRPGTSGVVKSLVTVGTVLLLGLAIAAPDERNSPSGNDPLSSPEESPSASPRPAPAPDEPVLARVPALAGLDLAKARRKLRTAGLSVGKVNRQPSAKAAGTVLKQGLSKGATLLPGAAVPLVVAAPFPLVPSTLGEGKAAAVRHLTDAGFQVETSTETRTSGEDGVVLGQEPSSGTRAKPNSVVFIVISNIVRPPVPTPSNCTPGYQPCLAPASDYDCAGGSGDGPGYASGPVYVSGSDPYDLDSDGDGVACEA
jgi:hypothetical protein